MHESSVKEGSSFGGISHQKVAVAFADLWKKPSPSPVDLLSSTGFDCGHAARTWKVRQNQCSPASLELKSSWIVISWVGLQTVTWVTFPRPGSTELIMEMWMKPWLLFLQEAAWKLVVLRKLFIFVQHYNVLRMLTLFKFSLWRAQSQSSVKPEEGSLKVRAPNRLRKVDRAGVICQPVTHNVKLHGTGPWLPCIHALPGFVGMMAWGSLGSYHSEFADNRQFMGFHLRPFWLSRTPHTLVCWGIEYDVSGSTYVERWENGLKQEFWVTE